MRRNTETRCCHVFFLLFSLSKAQAEITLTPCVGDTVNGNNVRVAEVRRGQTSQFHCKGLVAADTAEWRYLPDGGGADASAGFCDSLSGTLGCSVQLLPGFTPTRPSDSASVMTVDPGLAIAEGRVKNGSLGCRRGTDTSVTNKCLMDLIDQAEGTCSVEFKRQNSDDWVAEGSCAITSAYSSRKRYTCRWYRTKDSSPEVWIKTVSYTGPPGVCKFNEALPPAGRYSYRVGISPGEVIKDALFGSNNNEIRTPTAPTVSGCSSDSYIEENSPVHCTCSTTGLGQPAGRLVWRRVGTTSPVVSGDYGNIRLEVSQMLTRIDHEATQFNCGVHWATNVSGSPLTFKVGYKPEGLTFKLNSQSEVTEVTVAENATVTMTCDANSRPVATMTVHKDGGTSSVSSGPPLLTFTLDSARCADTGTYMCSGSNLFGSPDNPVSGKVYVTCSPRSMSTILPTLYYLNESISITFDVTAYPAPLSPFTFKYLGPGGTGQPLSPDDVSFNGSCRPKAVGIQHVYVCTVTVLEMMSGDAAGAYTVNITNDAGSQVYRFNVTYNVAKPIVSGPEESPTNFAAIGGGVGAVVVIAIIVAVIIIVVLRRRKDSAKGKERIPNSPTTAPDTSSSRGMGGYEDVEIAAGASTSGPTPGALTFTPAAMTMEPPVEEYATVDKSKKTGNKTPAASAAAANGGQGDLYAIVDKSKKTGTNTPAATAAAANGGQGDLYAIVDKSKNPKKAPVPNKKPAPSPEAAEGGGDEYAVVSKQTPAPKAKKDKKKKKAQQEDDPGGHVYGNVGDASQKTDSKAKKPAVPPKARARAAEGLVNQDGLIYSELDLIHPSKAPVPPPKPALDDEVIYSDVR